MQELGPGVAISSWKKRWDHSQEPHRKRPLDDSALEVETPGDPDTLEKVSRLPRDLTSCRPPVQATCLPELSAEQVLSRCKLEGPPVSSTH